MISRSDVTLDDLRARFPGVYFAEGPPRATDQYDKPYLTVAIGGVVAEGAITPNTYGLREEECVEFFWQSFAKVLGSNQTVFVRQLPTVVTHEEMVLDTFADVIHRRTRIKVKGRFSFHAHREEP